MYLDRPYQDSQFQTTQLEGASTLLFLGYTNGQSGNLTLRYKDSEGFHNLNNIADQNNLFQSSTIQGALEELANKISGIDTIVKLITGEDSVEVITECL